MDKLKNKAGFLFSLILAVLLVVFQISNFEAFAASTSVTVLQDVSTDSTRGANRSYDVTESASITDDSGSKKVNWVGSETFEYERAAIKFSLAGITGTITDATFQFYVVNVYGGAVVNLISTTDDTWNETDVTPAFPTYNPANIIYDSTIGTTAPYSNVSVTANSWKTFNVKDYIQSRIDAGASVVVFILIGNESNGSGFNFVSNQDSTISLWSKLNLTYTPAANSPVVTGTSPTNDTTPTWNWDSGGNGNGYYRYKLDSNDFSAAPTPTATNQKSYTPVTALSQGVHTLYVQESNGASPARWSTSGIYPIVIDTTAPALSTVTIASNNATPALAKTGDTITLNITASENINSPTVTISGKSATVGNAGDSDAKTWQATYTMQSSDTQGIVPFNISYSDLAGNAGVPTSSTTNSSNVTFDRTPPTLTISAPSATISIGGSVTYTLTYSGETAITLGTGNITLNQTLSANGTVGLSGSGSTRTVTISGITGNGTLGISIAAGTASDNAGNQAPAAGPSTTFTVDTTAPNTQNTVFPSNLIKNGNAAVTITSAGETGGTVWFAVAGKSQVSDFSAGPAMTTAGGTATSINAPANEGVYYLYVIDAAGNVSPASTATLTVDNTVPSNQNAVFPSSLIRKGNTAVTITSAGETGGAVWFAVAGKTQAANFSAGPAMTTAGGTATSINAPANEGVYYLYVIDAAGNVSPASTATLTVDNTVPSNQNVVFPSSLSKKANAAVVITSAGETGGAVWFAEAGKTQASDFSAGPAMTTAGGAATSINAPANEGVYYLYVIDVAGNVSSASTAALTVDNSSPLVDAKSPADNDINVVVTSNLVITFSENVVIGTGNIRIMKTSDESIVETISVTGGKVTGSGGSTITINPATILTSSTGYYVLIDDTAFADPAGNNYAGIGDKTTWNFTTLAPLPPTITFVNPVENAILNISTGSTVIVDLINNGSGINPGSVQIKIDTGDWVTPTALVATDQGYRLYYVITNINHTTTSHTIAVRLTDLSGNPAEDYITFTMQVKRNGFGFGRFRF